MIPARMPTFLQALDDQNLFGGWAPQGPDFLAWRSVLASLFGLPLAEAGLALWQSITGRTNPRRGGYSEAHLICGRRGGKTQAAALAAVYLAAFQDFRAYARPGERLVLPLLAQNRDASRAALGYVKGIFAASPVLSQSVESETVDGVALHNGVEILISTSSFKAVRGGTIVSAVCDEVAYWWQDSSAANPDAEVLAALRPGTATVPTAKLLVMSSPYRRQGVLWEAYREHFARDDSDVLVVQGATRALNPRVPEAFVAGQLAKDPIRARAEYLAEFRDDISNFIDENLIGPATRGSPLELPPRDGLHYRAFVDPSGGRGDAMTLAIAHCEGDRVVIDLCRGVRPPFDPSAVVAEFVQVLRQYRVWRVTADNYAAEWVKSAFAEHSVTLDNCPVPRSGLYGELLPMLTQGRIELPPLPVLASELRGLERRTGRGRDQIDHQSGGHDDHANAVAGAAFVARQTARAVLPRVLAL